MRRSEIGAIAVIVASVVATGGALAFGSGTTPKPGPEPTTTEPPPLPTESTTTSSTVPGATGAVTEATPITITGIGPLAVGIDLAEAERVTGVDFGEAGEGGCTTASSAGLEGVELVLADGRVAAVNFTAGSYATRSGIRIGATEQSVLDTYDGQIEQSEGALTFVPRDPADADHRIVFRTDGGEVSSFSAGLLPHVVEGCG